MRRTRLVAGMVTALALLVAGCATTGTQTQGSTATGGETGDASPAAASKDAFPVTIQHAFGSTTIKQPPERVATVSWVNADVALALGVVPVGMPANEWGGNKHQSTPWKDAALKELGAPIGSEDAPVQYSEANGINYTAIAELTPDLILAAYSGLTQEEYDKLSKIAPVVAYPKVPYGTPWQVSTRMIGKALGKPAKAEQLVNHIEQRIDKLVAQHPALKGKTFIYGNLKPGSGSTISVYTTSDNRTRFLSELGMRPAPVVKQHSGGDKFFFKWSAERANELKSDIFVGWAPKGVTKQTIRDDKLLGQIPAVRRGALVLTSDPTLTMAISAASPLSLPWALKQYVPKLAKAARAAEAADDAGTQKGAA